MNRLSAGLAAPLAPIVTPIQNRIALARQTPIVAISNLNSYNLVFVILGLLPHWRRAASSTR